MTESILFKKRVCLISDEVDMIHQQLVEIMPGLSRISVALYEEESGVLHTFLQSSGFDGLLKHYAFPITQSPSLQALAKRGEYRVIDDLSSQSTQSFHSKSILAAGFQSSFTQPLFLGKDLLGFIFFDSNEKSFFEEPVIKQLSVYIRLIEAILVMDVLPVRTLMGMLNSARHVTALKDEETGKHITRVASYVEIIASELSKTHAISDEEIEYMRLYAPLHDIGKISVPDEVMLKTAPFNTDDYEIMKLHVVQGIKIIKQMLNDFGFSHVHHTDMLINIIQHHHEHWDGNGYPKGLVATEIPIEGRIMAVADVFDALSSNRVYRAPYSLDYSLDYIKKRRGLQFDPECVDALIAAEQKVRKTFKNFKERGF